jgi:nicotinamidase-related amidase
VDERQNEGALMKKHDFAILSVDMHRGHLDPSVATLPLLPKERCERVIANAAAFFDQARGHGVPVISVVTMYRDSDEILSNPHWNEKNADPKATRRDIGRHNIIGEATTRIIPALYEDGDYVVNTKKRYSCYYGTELDFVLQQTKARNVVLTGINTSSCVLCTAFESCNRDYRVYVVEDCCDSMDGPEFHAAAVLLIDRIIGRVVSSAEMLRIIGGHGSPIDSK